MPRMISWNGSCTKRPLEMHLSSAYKAERLPIHLSQGCLSKQVQYTLWVPPQYTSSLQKPLSVGLFRPSLVVIPLWIPPDFPLPLPKLVRYLHIQLSVVRHRRQPVGSIRVQGWRTERHI